MHKSRPMTAPASRFKKKSFPPEIIGIPTSKVSPRINSTRPLSSIQRPVSAPITPARAQFDELSSTFDNFAEQTSVNITSPFLVAQFLRFSSRFNQFCDTSSTIKNSFFGNYTQRMKIHNSAIIVQARSMMDEWNDFQNFFIQVKSTNIVPIYKLISNCFTNLKSAIYDCYDLCGVGSRFETIPRSFQKYIDDEIKTLYYDSLNIFNERVKDFDPVEFYNRTLLFIQKTQSRLLTSFFKNRMTTADVMRRKMALNIAYEDLIKNLNATQNFDLLSKEVEDQIILMNHSIGDLYTSLNLPISLRKVRPILDDEGRSLNLSILRPSIDRTTALKESARRANTLSAQIEKVASKISQKNKKDNKNIDNENNQKEINSNENNDNKNENLNKISDNKNENNQRELNSKENNSNENENNEKELNSNENDNEKNQQESISNDNKNEIEIGDIKNNESGNVKDNESKNDENESINNSDRINNNDDKRSNSDNNIENQNEINDENRNDDQNSIENNIDKNNEANENNNDQ